MNAEKTYPKGTTKEQWDQYEIKLKSHQDYCAKTKPQKEDMDFVDATTGEFRQDKFNMAIAEWDMMCSCDAPNEPGYHRANND
jgi:hypothetical protein